MNEVIAHEFICKAGVVLLERPGDVRVGAGHGDGRVGIAGDRVGRIVDAGDAHADGGGEGRLLRRERHVVEHDRLRAEWDTLDGELSRRVRGSREKVFAP